MPLGTKKRIEEFMRLDPNRLPNQDGQRVRMRSRQTGLSPASVEATAFFSDLDRYRYGMKMKRQEKDREKQQQTEEAAPPRGAGFYARSGHNQLFTQVRIGCQSQIASPRPVRLARESQRKPSGAKCGAAPRPISNPPITKNNLGTGDLRGPAPEIAPTAGKPYSSLPV